MNSRAFCHSFAHSNTLTSTMMNGFVRRTLVTLCIVAEVTSFLYNPHVHPNLKSIANAQLGKLLQIRLDIGKKASDHRIALQGPVIKLLDSVTKALPLPGASGPTPQISSGAKSVEIVKDGFVIDMNGSRAIPFKDGCWEMIWKDGALDGTMVCGFNLPEPIKRNAASFPACRVYLSFPVWTKDTLIGAQAFKKQVQATRRAFLEEKNDSLAKMQTASNLFAKGLLYHAAAQAYEKAVNTPNINNIPDSGDLIELADGLCMSKKGTIWNRDFSLGHAHQVLGFATVSLCDTNFEG